jgi:hypothetical protein
MKTREIYLPALLIVGTIFLAFLLRGMVQDWVILPLGKLFWLMKGYYGAFPQSAYWLLALATAILIALLSLRIPVWKSRRERRNDATLPGSVREMSFWLQRSKGGIYPKWHVAHLLGELALDILDRSGTRQRHMRRLAGVDWAPPREVRNYLDAALTTNYSDYPKPKRFHPLPPTPFDQDLDPVISYLESLLEDEHDHHS